MRLWLAWILVLAPAVAQVPDADAEGCRDSKIINRIKGCMISECRVTEHDEAELPVSAQGDEIGTKTLEGALERVSYVCPTSIGPLQILRNVQNAFTAAGYQKVFEGQYHSDRRLYTVRRGSQWASVETDLNGDPMYTLTTLRVKDVDQQLQASAEAWTSALEQNGRVPVYGINFDTGKATIRPDSEPALSELLKLAQKNPEWILGIEGHTDNVGGRPANLALSRERAQAVVNWLVGKGVDKSRLNPAGLGDTKPVADNGSDEGRAKNRRVEIVKL